MTISRDAGKIFYNIWLMLKRKILTNLGEKKETFSSG
jgi:hypothetical protein